MQSFPHIYRVSAQSGTEGPVVVSSPGLPDLETAPPPEFDGPGDLWSPETLFAGAIANCFILTFRAIARASHLDWKSLSTEVEADLDRIDGPLRFTAVRVAARLEVPPGTDEEQARRLLEKAEHSCLVTRSLNAETSLQSEVVEG